MGTFETILNSELAQRIGWVLVHFLWQGTAVAILCAILLATLRKAKSQLRYTIACLAMLLMAALCTGTFFVVEVNSRPVALETDAPVVSEPAAASKPAVHVVIEQPIEAASPVQTPFWQTLPSQIERFIPWVVSIWFGGVCLLSVWYLGSWCQLQKLRRIGRAPIDERIAQRTQQLASQLGITKTVRIVE
ncbi:MAG: hypothetical protein ACYTET_04620, partial [Planctomycetota bacterium]